MLGENATLFVYDPHEFSYNRTLLWFNEKDVIAALNANNDFLFKVGMMRCGSSMMNHFYCMVVFESSTPRVGY